MSSLALRAAPGVDFAGEGSATGSGLAERRDGCRRQWILLWHDGVLHKQRFGGALVIASCFSRQSCQYTQVRQLGLRALHARLTPSTA